MRRKPCARGGSCWPSRSAWWWALALALAGCFGGWSAHSEELQQPTSGEPPPSPQLEQPWSPPWQTLLDDSMLLVTRLRERKQQADSLLGNLSEAGGKLSYSEELSLKLWQSLNGAVPLLQSLQTDLLGISSSLSGLRMDFGGLSSSLEKYFVLFRGQIHEVQGERDAARLQASAWRIAALVGGGVGLISLAALVVVLAIR